MEFLSDKKNLLVLHAFNSHDLDIHVLPKGFDSRPY